MFTAIVGGFIVSALGGSRYQIGGPVGAFIVGVSACVAQIGLPGLMVATFLSGFILMAAGGLKLGSYVKFLPYPVTIGFTSGIAVIILTSQIKELLGLQLTGAEPPAVLDKLGALWAARDTLSGQAVAVALVTIVALQTIKKLRPHWPNLAMAVVGISLGVWALHLPIVLVGDRFGTLPRFLPAPSGQICHGR